MALKGSNFELLRKIFKRPCNLLKGARLLRRAVGTEPRSEGD